MNAQKSGPSPVLVGVLIPLAALVIAVLAWLYPVHTDDSNAVKSTDQATTVSTPAQVVGSTSTTAPPTRPTSAATSVPPPPRTTAPAVYQVPQGFTGTWRGTLTQGSETYPVIVTIATGIVGDSLGSVEYPTLHCGGIWRLKSGTTNSISVEELIDPSPDSTCVATVPITLILNGTRLQYYIDDPVEVRGTLAK